MITLKHEHQLSFPTIEVPMMAEDEDNNTRDVKQSAVEGIFVPLFRFNNLTINFLMVSSMTLTCKPIPKIQITIQDHANLIKNLDTPGKDNMLYMQVLPPFDNAYKKIQMAFYITDSRIDGSSVTLWGEYSAPNIWDSEMKTYGLTTTYELFDEVSTAHKLGFCSNIDNTEDKRYIYNPNKNMAAFLDDEVEFGGNEKHVLEWWIDFWNNINLVDIFEEYSKVVEEDDMKIWISTNLMDVDGNNDPEPQEVVAAFSNHPVMTNSPMFITEYTPITNGTEASDINFEVYSMLDLDCQSTLIQDGDVHDCPVLKYKYGGEKFGEFDYLTQQATRDLFLSKINAQVIQIEVGMPLLGIIKGDKVNIWWYDINNPATDQVDNSEIESNIPLPDNQVDTEGSYMINKTISGQYSVLDIELNFNMESGWKNIFTLGRMADSIQRLNPPDKESLGK